MKPLLGLSARWGQPCVAEQVACLRKFSLTCLDPDAERAAAAASDIYKKQLACLPG